MVSQEALMGHPGRTAWGLDTGRILTCHMLGDLNVIQGVEARSPGGHPAVVRAALTPQVLGSKCQG